MRYRPVAMRVISTCFNVAIALFLAFFTHTLHCNHRLQRLIPGYTRSPSHVVIHWAFWPIEYVKTMAVAAYPTENAFTSWTVGHANFGERHFIDVGVYRRCERCIELEHISGPCHFL